MVRQIDFARIRPDAYEDIATFTRAATTALEAGGVEFHDDWVDGLGRVKAAAFESDQGVQFVYRHYEDSADDRAAVTASVLAGEPRELLSVFTEGVGLDESVVTWVIDDDSVAQLRDLARSWRGA